MMASPERAHQNPRLILVAPTKASGMQWAHHLGMEPVAIVTPRSTDAAYGITADAMIVCPGLTAVQSAELQLRVRPSLATVVDEAALSKAIFEAWDREDSESVIPFMNERAREKLAAAVAAYLRGESK